MRRIRALFHFTQAIECDQHRDIGLLPVATRRHSRSYRHPRRRGTLGITPAAVRGRGRRRDTVEVRLSHRSAFLGREVVRMRRVPSEDGQAPRVSDRPIDTTTLQNQDIKTGLELRWERRMITSPGSPLTDCRR